MERSVQHDADDGAPTVRRQVLRAHEEVAGGVVHECRHRPERGLGRVERVGDRTRLTHVGRCGDALAGQLRDGLVQGLTAATDDRDLRAEPAELERHRAAEAGAAAGNQHDAVGERALGEHQLSSSL